MRIQGNAWSQHENLEAVTQVPEDLTDHDSQKIKTGYATHHLEVMEPHWGPAPERDYGVIGPSFFLLSYSLTCHVNLCHAYHDALLSHHRPIVQQGQLIMAWNLQIFEAKSALSPCEFTASSFLLQ